MCTEYITTYACYHHKTTSHDLCRKLRRGECMSTEEIYKNRKEICEWCRERRKVDCRREKKEEGEESEEGRKGDDERFGEGEEGRIDRGGGVLGALGSLRDEKQEIGKFRRNEDLLK